MFVSKIGILVIKEQIGSRSRSRFNAQIQIPDQDPISRITYHRSHIPDTISKIFDYPRSRSFWQLFGLFTKSCTFDTFLYFWQILGLLTIVFQKQSDWSKKKLFYFWSYLWGHCRCERLRMNKHKWMTRQATWLPTGRAKVGFRLRWSRS